MDALIPDFSLETDARNRGIAAVAGVDEAGRGPLAGPVVAAAVILDPDCIPPGLNDSKLLSPAKRAMLYEALIGCAIVSVAMASVEEIDRINILRASHLAMVRAVAGLRTAPALALIDGNMVPEALCCPGVAQVKGDARCLSIAAASIAAKYTRDAIMVDLAQQHPGYGWETNMGYATRTHRDALLKLGVTPHHRRSFAPVHNILYQENS